MSAFLLTTLLSLSVPALAARRGGGGGGGGGIDLHLDLEGIDTAIFSITVVFAIFTFIQFLSSFGLLKQRCPLEEFPRRTPYGLLIVLATALLTVFYGMFAFSWANSNKQSSQRIALERSFYAVLDTLWRLVDIVLYIALIILFRQRRDAFIAEHQQAVGLTGAYQAPSSPFYHVAPFASLGMMSITTIIRLAIRIAGPRGNPAFDAYDAMAHLYIAFYLLTTATITFIGIALHSQASRIRSVMYQTYDANVLGRIVKMIIPVLIVRALFELALHIIIYLPFRSAVTMDIDYQALQVATSIIEGLTYLWAFYVAIGLGVLPKNQNQGNQQGGLQEKAAA